MGVSIKEIQTIYTNAEKFKSHLLIPFIYEGN